jgi:hypothetical protein|tara:strand:+ start:257 stop:496 length:240 start_codon:yes stop_codon:yes gene_type:complete
MYRYLYVKEFTVNKNQRLIRERVMKSDYRKVYSLEEIWKWIEWGLKKGIIKRTNDEKNIENVMRWIDLLGKSRFVSDLK